MFQLVTFNEERVSNCERLTNTIRTEAVFSLINADALSLGTLKWTWVD